MLKRVVSLKNTILVSFAPKLKKQFLIGANENKSLYLQHI